MRQRVVELDKQGLLAAYEQTGKDLPSTLPLHVGFGTQMLWHLVTTLSDQPGEPLDNTLAAALDAEVQGHLADLIVTPERVITRPGSLAGAVRLHHAALRARNPFTTLPPEVAQFLTQSLGFLMGFPGREAAPSDAEHHQPLGAREEEAHSQQDR
jgi:hypothetical protein